MWCKPGIKAVIIKSPAYPEALGRIVEVLSPCSRCTHDHVRHPCWDVAFVDAQPPSMVGMRNLHCPDKDMRPVTGLPDEEITRHETEPLPVTLVLTK